MIDTKNLFLFRGAVALATILLMLLPIGISGYYLRFATIILMWVSLATCWNMISYMGYVCFGHVTFFGFGAYFLAVLMTTFNVPFFPSLMMSGIATMFYAFLIGLPTLRLRGPYFAIATLGIAEATREIILNIEVTRGGKGITLPPYLEYSFFYYLMLTAVFSVVLIFYFISKSRIGYGLDAICGDEDVAETMGIDTTKYKVLTFCISTFFTGMIGGIYAYWMSYIDPPTVFSVGITVMMIVMTMLGGIRNILGPIIGGVLLSIISELLWASFLYWHTLMLGAILIVIIVFFPKGIVGLIRKI